jgi:crotonobetainyl-CoA:carnitine CoA-transferase CaiB-like acyl-CoA transferase
VENNSPRVLPNFGLTWEVLQGINPKLVMCSMPGFGNSGPLRDWLGFGINLEAYCGLSSVTGYADGTPVRSVIPYGDPIAGLQAVVAILAALRHARRTGEGQLIEVAQDESLINVLAEPFFRGMQGGELPRPDGGRHDAMAPHGIYQAADDDEWLCLAVEDSQQFEALARLIGKPEWAADPDLRTLEGRKAREDEIDAAIARWTATRGRHAAAVELNAAGVPAAPALSVDEIFADETLRRRGYWTEVEHPVTGRRPYAYLPFNLWRSEPVRPSHAPLFGEHNAEILRERLGMSAAEIQALTAEGVIATRPTIA